MPGLWREGWNLAVGHRWELIEDFPQVGQWIDPPPPAALDDRVDHGAALPGSCISHEQPVFLFMRSSA